MRDTLAAAHDFKSDDKRAVFVFDAQKQLQQFGIISLALKVLLAFIGTLTLGIGGVGLMNMMLVRSRRGLARSAWRRLWERDGGTFCFSFWRSRW